jgi:hypothetical protein
MIQRTDGFGFAGELDQLIPGRYRSEHEALAPNALKRAAGTTTNRLNQVISPG